MLALEWTKLGPLIEIFSSGMPRIHLEIDRQTASFTSGLDGAGKHLRTDPHASSFGRIRDFEDEEAKHGLRVSARVFMRRELHGSGAITQ